MTSTFACHLAIFLTFIVLCDAFYVSQEKYKIEPFIEKNSTISTYGCINNVCNLKVLKQNETQVNLESCKRDCLYSNLWPIPTTVGITNLSESSFRKNHITLSVTSPNNVKKDINRAFDTFMNYLPSSSRSDINLTDILIKINVSSEELRPTLQTDESYYISIEKNNKSVIVNIVSESYFGARHALETLSQLIWFDETSQNLQIYHGVEIKDKPAFPHRGLMVDTSRNFFPINKLLKVIDGMAANKLNVFHLHLTDSVSFPIVLPSNPWLAKYGAYSQKKTYTPDDIKALNFGVFGQIFAAIVRPKVAALDYRLICYVTSLFSVLANLPHTLHTKKTIGNVEAVEKLILGNRRRLLKKIPAL